MIALTGATGFVGRHVLQSAASRGIPVRAVVRRAGRGLPGSAEVRTVGAPWESADFREAVRGADVIIHLAGRAHVLRDHASDPLQEFRRANVATSVALARAALEEGVRRLVFVSTIKVSGERTSGRPFTEADPPAPEDPYAVSKAEAEAALQALAQGTRLELVVVRPPLIYGAGMKGNMLELVRLIHRGWPLPLSGLDNRRTLIGVRNLSSLLLELARHPAARGLYLAGDPEDVSTTTLVRDIAAALGRPPRLWACPVGLLRLGARVTGRAAALERLTGSLQVDAGRAARELGWRPPFGRRQELQACADWVRAGEPQYFEPSSE